MNFTRVTVYHTCLEIEVLYPWSLLAVWVFMGHNGRFSECSVCVVVHSSIMRSPIHVLGDKSDGEWRKVFIRVSALVSSDEVA